MAGPYAGFNLQELLILVPECRNMAAEAVQARLADIRSRYTPEEITAFLLAGTPPPEPSAIADKISHQERIGRAKRRRIAGV